jgi:hypothetical protein
MVHNSMSIIMPCEKECKNGRKILSFCLKSLNGDNSDKNMCYDVVN